MSQTKILKKIICPGVLEVYRPFWDTPKLATDILSKVQWRDDKMILFGKEVSQPRQIAWYADQNVKYQYSGITLQSIGIAAFLLPVKKEVERVSGASFNSILINYYRDGLDYMGWHSDDEKELGSCPTIASFSLGAGRDFFFRKKDDHQDKIKLFLEDGDLLIMKGNCQHIWQHSLPKRAKLSEGRINLTFRNIIG